MNEIIRVLKEARELISKPENWTQGASARDSYRVSCESSALRATCWCATGAILKTRTMAAYRFYEPLLETLSAMGQVVGIPRFNDSNTHRAVIKLFDDTIARLEEEEEEK